MPSELSRQLDNFRTKHKVVPAVQKVSFLFDPKRAAGVDVLSLAIIARKSLLDLAEIEPSLAGFEDLFIGTDRSVEFLSQDEQSELQAKIKGLLSLLSAHIKSLDAQQCIEYLVQKYHVHVYNGEELILMALPYHDTPLFGTLVKLIPFFKHIEKANPSETRWMFLRNVYKTGSPLSRQALVKMCRSSQPVMTAIIDHVIDSLKHGAFNEPLLAFANVLLLEVLSEFSLIKYDISIPIFSLCRICFKAASRCAAAFFVGLSVATHVVCVADVRDDALAILLSRAIAVCPADKAHALLMSLAVVASRRPSLPAAVVEAMNSIPELSSVVSTCVARFKADLSELATAVALSDEALAETIKCGMLVPASAPQVEAVDAEAMVEAADSDSSSDSSSDDEEDTGAAMRKTLNGLIAKGSKKDRLAAVEQFCAVPGATRYCIRLAALCASVDALALTMQHCTDAGFVPTLLGVVDQFTKVTDARLVMEAVFASLAKIPAGAIRQVGETLGVPAASAMMAVACNVECEFALTDGVWESFAAIVSGPTSQLGKTGLVASWRAEFLPSGFLARQTQSKETIKSFAETFIGFANNLKVRHAVSAEGRVGSVLGQLVCALAVPSSLARQALTGYAQKSISELSVAKRTEFITALLNTHSAVLFKKTAELEIGDVSADDAELVSAAVGVVSASAVSTEAWTLLKRLVEGGLELPADSLVAAVKTSNSVAAWKCVSSAIAGLSANPLAVHAILVQIAESVSNATSATAEVAVMVETLLAVSTLESVQSLVTTEIVADIVKKLTMFAVRTDNSVSDTLLVSAQTVCESLLVSGLEFDAAWTTVVQVMSELCQQHPESAAAVQVRCLVLLASLLEDADSETVTSKQLGQVVLGLVELVATATPATGAVDSWSGLAGSANELSSVVERIVSQFLLHCTLRKLDKMFRRLLAAGDNEAKLALVLRVYAVVCAQGGSAAALALLPVASDSVLASLKADSVAQKKRKRNVDLLLAGLGAVAASCVEEVPESHIGDFIEAVAQLPGSVDDNSCVAAACVALARVGSADQIKHLTKLLMQRSRDQSAPATQEAVVKTVLALWQSAGEAMVPSITEVTVYLSELVRSDEEEVAAATRQLVAEMDRITGEDIASKLATD